MYFSGIATSEADVEVVDAVTKRTCTAKSVGEMFIQNLPRFSPEKKWVDI